MSQTQVRYWRLFETPWGPITAVGSQRLSAVLLREPTGQEKISLGEQVTAENPLGSAGEIVSFGDFESWLAAYIAGDDPSPKSVEVQWPEDASEFCLWVWRSLAEVPAGSTVTYGQLARRWEEEHGGRMAAQAVGGALGRNPLPLVYPCHRVLSANGAITGYAGGTQFKHDLLAHENALDHVRPSER